jgi:hypothetical protein
MWLMIQLPPFLKRRELFLPKIIDIFFIFDKYKIYDKEKRR